MRSSPMSRFYSSPMSRTVRSKLILRNDSLTNSVLSDSILIATTKHLARDRDLRERQIGIFGTLRGGWN